MLLYWTVRFWHRGKRQWLDRHLLLSTDSLDAPTKAAVEYVVATRTSRNEREILRFRGLFREYDADASERLHQMHQQVQSVFLTEYFEDDSGRALTRKELAEVLTGSVDAVLLPHGAQPHDIDYFFAPKPAIPISNVVLSDEDVRGFGYFVRDLRELLQSALMRDGPGTLSLSAATDSGRPRYATAITSEELQSYVTVFRRLYMKGEPGGFCKSAQRYAALMGTHPIANWIRSECQLFEENLHSIVKPFPPLSQTSITFTVKTLLDSFIYSQYAHQPNDKSEKGLLACIQDVGGDKDLLFWLFTNEIWKCGLRIGNAGRVIARWFDTYCQTTNTVATLGGTFQTDGNGLGLLEKSAVRQARLFREKVEQLAHSLWEAAGRPTQGPSLFRDEAQSVLSNALGSDEQKP